MLGYTVTTKGFPHTGQKFNVHKKYMLYSIATIVTALVSMDIDLPTAPGIDLPTDAGEQEPECDEKGRSGH